jgi:hypothetical protein
VRLDRPRVLVLLGAGVLIGVVLAGVLVVRTGRGEAEPPGPASSPSSTSTTELASGSVPRPVLTTTSTSVPNSAATKTGYMSDTPTLSFEGLGPVHLGMTLVDASAASGIPINLETDGCLPGIAASFAGDPFSDSTKGELLFFLVDQDKRIVFMWVSNPTIATDKGIHRGSTREQVVVAYPNGEAGKNRYGTPIFRVRDPRGRFLELLLDADGSVVVMRLATSTEVLDNSDC